LFSFAIVIPFNLNGIIISVVISHIIGQVMCLRCLMYFGVGLLIELIIVDHHSFLPIILE
jgi:phosphate starvation-inducible membrane PsiE